MGVATAQTFGYKKVREKKWTASVRTLNMLKPVMTFVFKVLRNGLLKPVMTFVFKALRNGLLRSPTSGSEVHKVHRLGLLAILLGPVAAPRFLVALSHLPFDLHDLTSLALILEI